MYVAVLVQYYRSAISNEENKSLIVDQCINIGVDSDLSRLRRRLIDDDRYSKYSIVEYLDGSPVAQNYIRRRTDHIWIQEFPQIPQRSKRATQFLYLLMRDHLPTGTVASILEELVDNPEFTCDELAELAERYATAL